MMMKIIWLQSRIYAVALIVLLGSSNCYSQIANSIQSIKNSYQSSYEIQKLNAVEYATKHAIPISQITLEGNYLLLVDVVDGIPVFISTLNAGAATTIGVHKIQNGVSGLNLQGDGMLIGVWDGGSLKDHVEFGNRIISKEVDDDDSHATHVTGTLIAAGINANAKGMAPKASVTNWYFDNDLAEMAALVKPDETSLLFSNHSYGTVTGWTKVNGVWSWTGNPSVSPDEDFRFGLYGSKAKSLDQLANIAPYYTIVWAAGNDRGEPGDGSRPADCNGGTGYDCIIPEGVAKNIITVGAVNKVSSYTGPSSVVMSSFSSWGPTDDGRIKPDIVGAGVGLLSSSAVGDDTYEVRSGTSMATPNIAGSLVLIQELHKKLHGGAPMKSSTLKALAIHTAKEAGLLPGPDYAFGWGLLDVEAAAHHLISKDGVNNFVEEKILNDGMAYEKILTPKANQKITATLAWNDPAANSSPSALDSQILTLVNDLDIKLVAENGTEYFPWLLDPAIPTAQAIKGNNYRDNVEKLEFNLPEAKPYRLVVNHKGQLLGGAQSFSLILSYKSSLSTTNTFYWVGDSGNWGDNTHWSFTSGGSPALMVPGALDHVVIDENSFDGIGTDQISVLENRSVGSVKWLRTSSAGLELQGNILSVGKELIISNGSFMAAGTGIIKCISNGTIGNLYLNDADLGLMQLVFEAGDWTMRGKLTVDQLELMSGKLTISQSELNVLRLNATTLASKELVVENSEIKIADQSDLDGSTLDLIGTNSKIVLQSPTTVLNWNEINFNGIIEVAAAAVTITGSNYVNHLKLNPGSTIKLGDGFVLQIDSLSGFEGQLGNPISISSPSKSTIMVARHFLLCTDYVNVTNVDLEGAARINMGENSTVSNSLNWLSQPCSSVLFANFDEAYLCQNGFTEFIDSSKGPVTAWDWNFGDPSSAINTSTSQNAFHGFENPGRYQVSLTVRDGQLSHSYTKEIEISPSALSQIDIAVNATNLTCSATATSYQWFLNEQKIEGATNREYAYNGADGLYRVVIYDGECNRTSSLITITGLEEQREIKVFPNPTKDIINVQGIKSMSWITIMDAMGRNVYFEEVAQDLIIPAHHFPSGIYFLQIKSSGLPIIQKIAVNR